MYHIECFSVLSIIPTFDVTIYQPIPNLIFSRLFSKHLVNSFLIIKKWFKVFKYILKTVVISLFSKYSSNVPMILSPFNLVSSHTQLKIWGYFQGTLFKHLTNEQAWFLILFNVFFFLHNRNKPLWSVK